MCDLAKLIFNRIRDYEHDINYIKNLGSDQSSRLTQDRVIIQELEKILSGKGLEKLSYVS